MAPPADHQHASEPGGHTLGPHVIGRRVVVRRLVRGERGPSGGPAMTDVLGVCTAWGEGRCVVVREDGTAVEIALGDIVSGKPVPPRASVRSRVEAQEVEEHIGALWSSLSTQPLGDWALRASPPHSGRLRRRGNSALAMREPGIDWAAAASGVRRFYEARDQVPMIQVQRGSAVEATLGPLGFGPVGDGDAHAQLASVARALRSVRAGAPDVRTSLVETAQEATVSLEDGAGTGRGVLSGDWLLVESVVVDPSHRRRGLATAVLADLLDWGASLGATTALLHVETGNTAAIALYERHGFVTHHTNRYLAAR